MHLQAAPTTPEPPQFVDDPTFRRIAEAADEALADVLADDPLQQFLDDVLAA